MIQQANSAGGGMRERLVSRRNELIDRLAGCGLVIEPTADDIDRIVGNELRDQETTKASTLSSSLRAVEAALRRVDSGSFGICEQCDTKIPEKRLVAVPWARYCVRCQEKREQEAADEGRSRWDELTEELAS